MEEQAEPTWMTDEIRALLNAIGGEHVGKKRTTAILVGVAKANDEPLTNLWDRADTCSEAVWWRSWSKNATIKAVVEAVKKRILEWTDDETARIEAKYRTERRREVAKYASQAPVALASVMASPTQRGSDRINAAVTLIKLADPDDAATVGTVASVDQSVLMQMGRFEDALKRAYGPDESTGDGE